jgi:hypothetical protein
VKPNWFACINGYLMQVVEDSALTGIRRIGELAEVSAPKWSYMPWEIKRIAHVVGVKPAILEAFGPVRMSRLTFATEDCKRTRRVCPQCLVEGALAPQEWNIIYVRACYKHQVQLLDTCPGCDNRLTWAGESIRLCARCDAELKEVSSVPVNPANYRASEYLSRGVCTHDSGNIPRFQLRRSVESDFVARFSQIAAVAAGEVSPNAKDADNQLYIESTDPALDAWLTRGFDLMLSSPDQLLKTCIKAMAAAPTLSRQILASIAALSGYQKPEPSFVWTVELALADKTT